jgi:thymidylate kinase
MSKKKIFVCFIGSDGSGKSTLADSIFQSIRNKKRIKVKKVYGRHQPVLMKAVNILGRRIFFRAKNNDNDNDRSDQNNEKNNNEMFLDYDEYLINKKLLYKKRSKLIYLYTNLLIIEYYFQILFNIIIPYKLGYSIISDRYVYDTIINDLAVDQGLSIKDVKKILDRFWLFIPRPDIAFLVQVPEEVAIKRKNDIPSMSYLKIRNKLYNEIANSEQIIILDGTLKRSQLEDNVQTWIENKMQKG